MTTVTSLENVAPNEAASLDLTEDLAVQIAPPLIPTAVASNHPEPVFRYTLTVKELATPSWCSTKIYIDSPSKGCLPFRIAQFAGFPLCPSRWLPFIRRHSQSQKCLSLILRMGDTSSIRRQIWALHKSACYRSSRRSQKDGRGNGKELLERYPRRSLWKKA